MNIPTIEIEKDKFERINNMVKIKDRCFYIIGIFSLAYLTLNHKFPDSELTKFLWVPVGLAAVAYIIVSSNTIEEIINKEDENETEEDVK